MTCSNCARHVTEAIQKVAGVRQANVILDAGCASVRWQTGRTPDVTAVLQAIQAAGFQAKIITEHTRDHGGQQQKAWRLNLWIGVGVTISLMAGEWLLDLGMVSWFRWLAFVMAGLVQIFAGAQFYRGAWRQLQAGGSNMDTLVALGSTTAFGYSAWALLSGRGGHLYFMEAAAIITLISLGHWLEARVSARASNALKSLLQLAPQTARRIGAPAKAVGPAEVAFNRFALLPNRKSQPAKTGAVTPALSLESEVPVAELRIGDLVALRPGDRVPVDGVVVSGNSAVNEAMLTGESAPVDKSANSELYAGTVNLNGRLVMRVTATGENTALAHIIASVQRAQTSRANIQRLGDRVSNVFVPVVVLIALAAGLFWGLSPDSAALMHAKLSQFLWPAHPPMGAATGFIIASAVLIIACPCAMGLATPAAIMAGANAAASRGILIRDGVALEKAGKITAVMLDKTGTLTTGELAVASPWTPDGLTPTVQQAKELAGALARPSNHPVSRVIAGFAGRPTELQNWKEISGAGVQATLDSNNGSPELLRLGSVTWLRSFGVAFPDDEELIEQWRAEGATLVGLAKGESLLGIFALRDSLKPGAANVVRQLQGQGLKIFLLTGDHPQTAATIAKQVGIKPENVFAEVRPEQKAEFVKKLQQQGERVAFVGDGINDAPALQQADLGIAVGRASDIAREAADIILLKSEIEAVPEALGLARATLRTIKQNLFWAFFYNAIGVPLAALGFMSPILCASAMGASDLVVVGNALRLARWRAG